MFKIMLLISVMSIGTSLWAARLSCDSCGSECSSACGTRRFRTCCFNYLRRKRGPETEVWSANNVDVKHETSPKSKLPYFNVENIAEQMTPNHINDVYKLYYLEDDVDNLTQA